MKQDTSLTRIGDVLLKAQTIMQLQIINPSDELCLSADSARELAARLVHLADPMDGVPYKVWRERRKRDSLL